MPSRERQGRAKHREEYIQNRDGELETSRAGESRSEARGNISFEGPIGPENTSGGGGGGGGGGPP